MLLLAKLDFENMNFLCYLSESVDKYPDSVFLIKQHIDQELGLHSHEKGQLLLVFGGIAYLQTEEMDYYIPSHHYIWIPKQKEHRILFNSKDLYIQNIYFSNESDLDCPFYNKLGIYPVSPLLHEMLRFSAGWQGDAFPVSWEYEFLLTMKHLLPNENLKRFSIQLPTTTNKKLMEVTQYLRNNLHEHPTLPAVAQYFGISVRSMTRLFQSGLCISFGQYLKMLRIVRSLELMKESDISITEIAYGVGYSSVSAFSNVFFQLTNTRPKDFKMMLTSRMKL